METLGLSTWETLERGNGIQTVLDGGVVGCGVLWVPGKVFEGCLSPAGWWDGGCPGLFTTEGITAVKCGNNVRFLLWGPVWGTYCIAFQFYIFCI